MPFKITSEIDMFLKKLGGMQYFYHFKPTNFKGKILYPLSKLEEVEPTIFKQEIKKYERRTNIPNKIVKPLNVKWKDCLNCSTVNPEKLFQLMDLLDLSYDSVEIFKFPITVLKDKKFCLYDDATEKFSKCTVSDYKEQINLAPETVTHYITSKKKKEKRKTINFCRSFAFINS